VNAIVLAGLDQTFLRPVGVAFDLVEDRLDSCRLEESLDLGGGEVGDALWFKSSCWSVGTLMMGLNSFVLTERRDLLTNMLGLANVHQSLHGFPGNVEVA